MRGFENDFQEKALFIYISELCEIPAEMCTDWVIYDAIMHHLVMNAIKFNKFQGSIIIDMSYHKLPVPRYNQRLVSGVSDEGWSLGTDLGVSNRNLIQIEQ